jgi:DNA-binding MarR family transcriptional regulator
MVKQTISSFAKELFKLIPHIVRGMFSRQADVLGQGKITLPQFFSLDLLDSRGPLKMKDIAEELNISLPAATGLVNRLVILKLVKRVYDAKDRRVIYITLTSKGKEMIAEIRAKRIKAIEQIFGQLTDKERSDYLKILRKLMKILYPHR